MKKEKTVQTPELFIAGNIMAWKDSVIQLSNISSISTVPLALKQFPLWTLIGIFIGLLLFKLTISFFHPKDILYVKYCYYRLFRL